MEQKRVTMKQLIFLIATLSLLSACAISNYISPDPHATNFVPGEETQTISEFKASPKILRDYDRIGNCYVKPNRGFTWCGIYSLNSKDFVSHAIDCKKHRVLKELMLRAINLNECEKSLEHASNQPH